MKSSLVTFAILLHGVGVSGVGVTPEKIASYAKENVGSTRWYSSGRFVYDVLTYCGIRAPELTDRRYGMMGMYPMMNSYGGGWCLPLRPVDWGDIYCPVLVRDQCWNLCTGTPQPGDIISDKLDVAIVIDNEASTRVVSYTVEKSDWGFRESGAGSTGSLKTCWRYNYDGC